MVNALRVVGIGCSQLSRTEEEERVVQTRWEGGRGWPRDTLTVSLAAAHATPAALLATHWYTPLSLLTVLLSTSSLRSFTRPEQQLNVISVQYSTHSIDNKYLVDFVQI